MSVLTRALAIALLTLVTLAPRAGAHAVLVGSSPMDETRVDRAPSIVTLTFDEPVSLSGDPERVFADNGPRADTGQVGVHGNTVTIALRPDLPPGSYTVTWRLVSADTHMVTGSLRFGIRVAPSDISPIEAPVRDGPADARTDIAHGLVYLGLVLAVGVTAVTAVVWPGVGRRRGIAAIIGLGWAVTLAGTLWQLAVLGAQAPAVDAVLGARIALIVVSAALTWAATRPTSSQRCPRLITVARLAVGAGVVGTVAGVGHASPMSAGWITTLVAAAHIATMTLWLGGLLVLAVAIGPRARRLSGRAMARYLGTWPQVAFGCVAVIVLTGEFQAWRQIQPMASLWSTRYGVMLLIKVALVAGIVALAWWNRLALTRGRRMRAVVAELALAAGVLATTSLLVAQPPARTVYGPAVDVAAPLGTDSVAIHVGGTRRGRQNITVRVLDHTGVAISVPELSATMSAPESGVAGLRIPLQRDPHDAASWRSVNAVVPVPGRWTVTVTVGLSDHDASVTSTQYSIW